MQMISGLIGGVGLFVLGMVLLTDGLKAGAGARLQHLLSNFTGGPLKALLSGAGITALVQSSSATTLATIGFVSAGLLTFSQAVGVVFGANLGTTTTGWIVSLLGLKLQIGVLALPFVGAGALLRVAARGRMASFGLALAGFGLVFIGIDVLQGAMRSLTGQFDPARLPGDAISGRLLLVAVGAAMTVVMQSSSAALATTLAALDARTIDLHHGAALVIGQNLGTTVTAAVAAFRASVPAKRTAVAHIGFNLITGAVALAILPLLLAATDLMLTGDGGPTTLAAFHTVFNVLGVALLFPFIDRYAGIIIRLVPERVPLLTRNLDASVTAVPAVAIEALRRTLVDIMAVAATTARTIIVGSPQVSAQQAHALASLGPALGEARRFAASIGPLSDSPAQHVTYVSLFHAIDHLERLVAACSDSAVHEVQARPSLAPAREMLARALRTALDWIANTALPTPLETTRGLSRAISDLRRTHRRAILERTAFQEMTPDDAAQELGAMQWLEKTSYHTWRAIHHLGGTAEGAPAVVEETFEDTEGGTC
jgi:phosphate:Na+ symporter